jgi:two-component system sensor histidine kinase HydH
MAKVEHGKDSVGFPTRVVLFLIGAISLALILSAGHSYFTLKELRTEYLENRARDIATMISQSAGGRGRRSSQLLWEQAIEIVFEERSESLRFVLLVDHEDNILAQAGFEEAGSPSDLAAFESQITSDEYLYVHEMTGGGGGPWWEADRIRVSRILLVLDAAEADFLLRQAYVHIVVSGVALLALWILSFYLVRTVRRFLDFKVQEESERHLASLGRMSATLAHEIRNPLGAMKGLTQVVREELPPEHTTQAMLKTVVDEARRLEGLVTDLLSFARTRQIQLTEFDLIALTEEVVALIQQETADVETIVSVASSADKIPITSDRDGLEQVLFNIVRNAIEASSKGGQVVIDLRAKNEKEAVITVKDQGEGIGNIDPEELFQPFKTTKARGSGLGLAVSRQIVMRLGGRIALSANADLGAECTVEIPRRAIPSSRREGQLSSKERSR